MVSRVKYSKRIKTAPTHASKTTNGQEGDSQQGVVARYGHDKTQKKSWTSTTSVSVSSRLDPVRRRTAKIFLTSFCVILPSSTSPHRSEQQVLWRRANDKPTDAGTLEAVGVILHAGVTRSSTALFKNALLRYEEGARKGALIIARSNLPKAAYRGWKGALHQQSEQKENK
ncbi:hypothetical protein DPMN_159783 [Dreissena polymorpha]|uniref:Uncharacterized protein n=1 Tax=Dreissena polymorpha TaxID=45954 RepID=A0A9D4EM27_DREPO|nr:hypothetical protein DPMN_159783 [Dreissena polymorpha]